jgi:glycosidase
MKHIILLFSLLAALAIGCGGNKSPEVTAGAEIIGSGETKVLQHPSWSKNATIYEVNVRQHTPEGTFVALERDLVRLDSLGVDIHPIGEKNRKGSLGSYYSVKDYKAVNPEFGTLDDFKRLVRSAHDKGMRIILDWVANHTAWDNAWITEHPDWYTRDTAGNVLAPVPDWSDVADLNYDSKDMRRAMIESMQFWVKEADVDGFRCDVGMMVPTDFWNETRTSLDSLKPVFMLAEAEQKDHHLKAFDMSYAWEFMHICNDIAIGKKSLNDIDTYVAKQDTAFPRSAYRMYFTTNHDENTWNGTGNERLGKLRQVFDVLAFTMPNGMPLLYTSQEGGEQYPDGNPHRLRFFDKDTTNWNKYMLSDFYSRLLKAHQRQEALWNGEYGGTFERLKTSSDDVLYCYRRKKNNSEVLVFLNFSDKPQKIDFTGEGIQGEFKSIFNNQSITIYTKGGNPLSAHGYQVFVK